ncbi:MAG: hypothetical protein KKG99_05670 [Bacteroidetes bacterium]|nr:hypothetical protein [Bacteroidota bacterium]
MTDTINKILQIGLLVVFAISAVLFVLFYINGESMTDTVLTWAYILFAFTIVLLIGFPIAFFIKNPKSGLRMLYVIVGFAILYGISYAFASDATNADIYEKAHVTPGISKFIGGGLIMTYILIGITILSLAVASIRKMLN